ncbi:hypothetical protein CVD28_01990 [Bacillus sp. M6-12]|uniref:hypothetical protein n=1 Tax=Bacillus sp. M6-12 TaxID=2054166 RepID=UPI000C75967F|nr:hypothetical protein [Bacillus sp. M6-12]PLS19203.1 hypothetical protein CVD28_01990 [Bacillus sp. M6-12]
MKGMNQEEIYQEIVNFEQRAGESFLDQGFNLHELTFMTWCYGKGYLTKEKYNLWVNGYQEDTLEATDANYYVYAPKDHYGDDVPFAVVISEEWNEKDQEKAHRILAEFISGIDLYVDRLKEFVK